MRFKMHTFIQVYCLCLVMAGEAAPCIKKKKPTVSTHEHQPPGQPKGARQLVVLQKLLLSVMLANRRVKTAISNYIYSNLQTTSRLELNLHT